MQRRLRLRSRKDFRRVYRDGRSVANSRFVVYWRPRSEPGPFRLGVSASARLGKAVVRNRARRMVKEIVRLNADKLRDQVDLVIIVRKQALELGFWDMEKSVLHLLRKAGLTRDAAHGPGSDKGADRRGNPAKGGGGNG
ncbi:MAG: ribonuclease P protein component [Paenibacillaceae bacterium ZCTH02-B3]|nr:MAG: ribonuclease P protein component [Paenibacillaceae bacterium ZCTH02-B3]